MGFFETFATWLDALLLTYISDNSALVAAAIEPAVVVLGTLYVMLWGYGQLAGRVSEPFMEGAKRILTVAVILAVSLRLGMYNAVIVDTFFQAPGELAAAVVGVSDPVQVVDQITNSGNAVGERLLSKGGVLNDNFAYYIAGFLVYAAVCLTAVYAMFLLSLSKIALSVLLAIGPLFFPLAMFESSKKLFESWLAQLANYALVAILTVLVSVLMLHVLSAATEQAEASGPAIQIAHAIRVSMTAVLTLLVLRQVMPMAAGVASGLSLTTFGVFGAAVAKSVRRVRGSTKDFTLGMIDPAFHRRRGLSAAAGAAVRISAQAGVRMIARRFGGR